MNDLKNKSVQSPGFTLVELVISVAILGMLFAVVLIALNPKGWFEGADDDRRHLSALGRPALSGL